MKPQSSGAFPRPRVDETLDGRFFLRRELGSGNFGTVYLAEQRVFGIRLRNVALKLLHGETINASNASEKLRDAIFLMQMQEEPDYAAVARNLVAVIDAGFLHERPGQAYVSMEFVSGYQTHGGATISTLQEMIAAYAPVPVDLAVHWMMQIAKPLAWMHSLARPVLHCDLKPDNILVSGKDTLKVADFGLAQLVFGVLGSREAGGALVCQSPEALTGVIPTTASDVYSLGLIFYEILAGHNPFEDVAADALALERHAEYREAQVRARAEGARPLGEIGHPELSDHPLLVAMVERCLRFRPVERYDDAAALLQDLERYSAGSAIHLIPEEKPPDPASPSANLDRLLAEAQVQIEKGRLLEARARCEEARRRFPKSGKPHRWLAEILLHENKWEDALQVCAEGMDIDPNEPELFDTAGNARAAGNQPDAAAMMRQAASNLRRVSVR